MVFVRSIVAVLHVGARELAEANRDCDLAAAVVHASDAVDVLARPLLPFGGRLAVTCEDSAFLEVNVDVVAPAAVALEVPDFEITEPWRGRDSVRIHAEHATAAVVRLDAPRVLSAHRQLAFLDVVHRYAALLELEAPHPVGRGTTLRVGEDRVRDGYRLFVSGGAASELEGAVMRAGKLRRGKRGQRDHLLLARNVVCGIQTRVGVGVGVYPKLEELSDDRIAVSVPLVFPGEDVSERNRAVWALAVVVLEQVDHVEPVVGFELGRIVLAEVDDDVVALRD